MGAHLRDVHLLVLILVEITLDELFKVPQAHLPRLTLLLLHLIEPCLAQSPPNVFLEPVIQKGTSTQSTSAHRRLFDP